MKNSFGFNKKNSIEFDDEAGYTGSQSSPNQLVLVWNGTRDIVVASPFYLNGDSTYEIDLARFPNDFTLAAAVQARRENQLNLPTLSEQTHFLTVVPDFSERTRILALNPDVLAYDDDELAEWLLTAERQIYLGTDNHPIFETTLEDTACSIRRLPNGQVSMTEVPRPHVQAVREKLYLLLGDDTLNLFNITVETTLRCAARYFLTVLPEGATALREGKNSEVTAFLIVNKTGFSYGLWSPTAGLFSEYAFPAPSEIIDPIKARIKKPDEFSSEKAFATNVNHPHKTDTGADAAGEDFENSYSIDQDNRLDKYVRHAIDLLYLQLSPEKLEQLQLSGYAKIVWAADAELAKIVGAIAAEYSINTGMDFFQMPVPAINSILTAEIAICPAMVRRVVHTTPSALVSKTIASAVLSCRSRQTRCCVAL